MDVGCSQLGFAASTMTPLHHTGSAIPHFPENSTPPAHVLQHKDAPICPSTASQGAKTLFIHPIWMWDAMGICSLYNDPTTSYRLGHTPFSLKSPTTCTCNTAIMMHPYAHPQHLKKLKLFVYIQYGCEMQSMRVCSLNHDTTTSYRLGHTPFPLKLNPTCTRITA